MLVIPWGSDYQVFFIELTPIAPRTWVLRKFIYARVRARPHTRLGGSKPWGTGANRLTTLKPLRNRCPKNFPSPKSLGATLSKCARLHVFRCPKSFCSLGRPIWEGDFLAHRTRPRGRDKAIGRTSGAHFGLDHTGSRTEALSFGQLKRIQALRDPFSRTRILAPWDPPRPFQ